MDSRAGELCIGEYGCQAWKLGEARHCGRESGWVRIPAILPGLYVISVLFGCDQAVRSCLCELASSELFNIRERVIAAS